MVSVDQQIRNDQRFIELKSRIASLRERHSLSLMSVFELLSEKDIYVPVTAFNDTTSCLETVAKYLHENLNLPVRRIAGLLNRSDKTVSQAYRFAVAKLPGRMKVELTEHVIPVSVFADRTLSNLEAAVCYLKNRYGLRFSEIAGLLKRDQRTIWTVYARARAKNIKKAEGGS